MSRGLFASLYQTAQPFALIDTREKRQYVNGHWFGSTNVPLSRLRLKITRFVPDRGFPIHLLDWQDAASKAAAHCLSDMGYRNIVSCKTSEPGRYGDGFVKGEYVWSKAFGEIVAHTCGLPEITPAQYLANHKDAQLFDVRPTAEYAQFTIPGSQSLPNSLLLANTDALKQSGVMALLHCAGRTRSIIGASTLKAAGYDGSFAIFKGGTQAWQLDGLEREFNASRLFASDTDHQTSVEDFLRKWNINYQRLDNTELASFTANNTHQHLFDVSDDAATGQLASHNIIRVSGTNLIQQTDQSIARYHVPVVLFDLGSGSRAAFAAYWLQTMGFNVSVVYLTEPIVSVSKTATPLDVATDHKVLCTDDLLELKMSPIHLIDFRPSSLYNKGHISGSRWGNIGETLQRDTPTESAIAVIGSNMSHANETADMLKRHGWQIEGICGWEESSIDTTTLNTAEIESPVDQSGLFAGRHYGNMQDSRDYLAWEEALPGQIDQEVHTIWLAQLNQPPLS